MKFLIIALITITANASNFRKCNAHIEVTHKDKYLYGKVLKVEHISTGFGNCSLKKGGKFEFGIQDKLKIGMKLWVEYSEYSAMGPNGVVSGSAFKPIDR
jgi:hypothetical protein